MTSFTLKVIAEFIDKLSGPAKKTVEELQGIAKSSVAAEKSVAAMGSASEKGAALMGEAFVKTEQSLIKVATASKEAETALSGIGSGAGSVERLDGAIKATSSSAAKLARELAALERGPGAGTAAHTKSIQAKGAQLEQQIALEKRARELHQEGKNAGLSPVPSGGMGMMDTVIGFGATMAGTAIVTGVAHQGAEAQHAAVAMDTAGMPPAEMTKAHEAAARLSGEFRMFTQTEIENAIREIRSVTGTTDAAIAAMHDALSLAVISEAQHPGSGLENMATLMKGAETQGATISGEKLHDLFDAMAKSKNVLDKTISDEDWALGLKYAGTAGQHWDKEFITEYLPHFLQELKGAPAGTMFQSMSRAIQGGMMSADATKILLDMGLIDPNKVEKRGKGYKMHPGALLHGDEFMHNPVKYGLKYMKPALDAKQVPEAEREAMMDQAFSNRNVARAFGLIDTQGEVIEKTAHLLHDNKGLETSKKWMNDDPTMAKAQVYGQIDNLYRQAAEPLNGAYTWLANMTAKGIAKLNQTQKGTPAATAETGIVAGFLGYLGLKSLGGLFSNGLSGAVSGATEAAGTAAKFGGRVGPAGMLISGGMMINDAGGRWQPEEIVNARMEVADLYKKIHVLEGISSTKNRWDEDTSPETQKIHAAEDKIATLTAKISRFEEAYNTGTAQPGLDAPRLGHPWNSQAQVQTLAQPQQVTNTTTNNINAPVTVNVTQTNASPAAIGGAVAGAVSGSMIHATRQSGGTLHDGYGPH